MRRVETPQSVRDWNRAQRARTRRTVQTILGGDIRSAMDAVSNLASLPTVPANVAADYAAYVAEWNAAAAEHNAPILARRAAKARDAAVAENVRAVAAVRAAACSHCFSTHPGEC